MAYSAPAVVATAKSSLSRDQLYAGCSRGMVDATALKGSKVTAFINRIPRVNSPIISCAVSNPTVTRVQPVPVRVVQGADRQQQQPTVAMVHIDHGNYGDLVTIDTVNQTEFDENYALDVVTAGRAISNLMPGTTADQARNIGAAVSGLVSVEKTYEALFFRLLCVAEAVAQGWAMHPVPAIGAGVWAPFNVWPGVGAGLPAQVPGYDGMIESLNNNLAAGEPGICMLNCALVSKTLTVANVVVLWLCGMLHCGIENGLGPNPPGVGGRVNNEMQIYIFGRRGYPAAPVGPVPAIGMADVASCIERVLEMTGDSVGYMSAYGKFCSRVHFLGPELTNLQVNLRTRFRLNDNAVNLIRFYHSATRWMEDPARYDQAECDGLLVAMGAVAGAAPAVLGAPPALPTAQGLSDYIASFALFDDFDHIIPSDTAVSMGQQIAGFNPFVWLGIPAAAPVGWAPVGANALPNGNRIESSLSLPADGRFGRIFYGCSTGLESLLANLRKMPMRRGSFNVSRLTTTVRNNMRFLGQVYFGAVQFRAAADTATRLVRSTPNSDASQMGAITTGNPGFDAAFSSYAFEQVAEHSDAAEMSRMAHVNTMVALLGVSSQSFSHESDVWYLHGVGDHDESLMLCAFHPAIAGVVLGEASVLEGGMYKVQRDKVCYVAGERGGLLSHPMKDVTDNDLVGLINYCSAEAGYEPEWNRRLTFVDMDTRENEVVEFTPGRMYQRCAMSMNVVGTNLAYYPGVWWYADGLPAYWRLNDWAVGRKPNQFEYRGVEHMEIGPNVNFTPANANLELFGMMFNTVSTKFRVSAFKDRVDVPDPVAPVAGETWQFEVSVISSLPFKMLVTTMVASTFGDAQVSPGGVMDLASYVNNVWKKIGGGDSMNRMVERVMLWNKTSKDDSQKIDEPEAASTSLN